MWVRDNDEGEVSEGEDTFGEADGEDGTSVAGGGEQALGGERRIAMSKKGKLAMRKEMAW